MTSITATRNPGDANTPPHIRLAVADAPTPPTEAYVQDFTTVVGSTSGPIDGWNITFGDEGPAYIRTVNETIELGDIRLRGSSDTTTPLIVARAVTGLTVGTEYYFRVRTPYNGLRLGKYALAVGTTDTGNGLAWSGWLKPKDHRTYYTTLYFTPTASTVYIQLRVYQNVQTSRLDYAAYDFDGIRVRPGNTWADPTLLRTDVNGTDVPVRLYQNGQAEPTTPTWTIYDWEAAHTGTVAYTLVDGIGATATTSIDVTDAYAGSGPVLIDTATGQYITAVVPDYMYPEVVTGFDSVRQFTGSVHTIIGREDVVANPGPLMLREGALTFRCSDYASALAIQQMIESGNVLFLAQADLPGMDMFFVSRQVEVRALEDNTPTQRWEVVVGYAEVSPP